MLEDEAPYKSQYVAGEISPMPGVEPWQNRIAGNLMGMFYVRFRGRSCHTYSSGLRLRVKAAELWTYPSLCVVCAEPRIDKSAKIHSLLNPQAIFEALTPSTEDFDRGDKFERYKQIDSLTDYVLVASEKMRVEHYVRQTGGGWLYHEYHDSADVLKLASVEAELLLAEIYERVTFPEPDEGV